MTNSFRHNVLLNSTAFVVMAQMTANLHALCNQGRHFCDILWQFLLPFTCIIKLIC